MRIVILNNRDEAEDYGKNYREQRDVILPIGVTARHYAIKNNWEMRTLGSLWKTSEYYKAKDESERRIIALIRELNDYSKSVAKNFPVTVGDYFEFDLRVAIGIIHYNQFILDGALSVEGLTQVVIYKYDNKKNSDLINNFWPDHKSILSLLPVNHENKHKLKVLDGRLIQPIKISEYRKKTIKNIIKSYLSEEIIARVLSIKKWFLFNNISFNKRKKLLSIGAIYDWDQVFLSKKFNKKYCLGFLNFDHSYGLVGCAVHRKAISSIMLNATSVDAGNFFDMTLQSNIISNAICFFDKNYASHIAYIKKYSAVLSTVRPSPKSSYLCHLANISSVPVINWQHGEMNLYPDLLSLSTEIRYTNHYLCYGIEVAPRYRKYINNLQMKSVHVVGSTKNTVANLNDKCIVYCTGKWLTNGIMFTDVIDVDSKLYNAQTVLIKYLSIISNNQNIVLKGSTGPNELPYNIGNISIDYETPFVELLKNAKLVILDAPATTCIETCATDIPLFVLSGRNSWFNRPMELLKKRAIVENTPEVLVDKIDSFIKNGKYCADVNNKEFLSGWGAVASVEKVIDNVLQVLDKVVK